MPLTNDDDIVDLALQGIGGTAESAFMGFLTGLKTEQRRIGVVGLYNSGKTVLLTSLINHLQHHDPTRFALGHDRVIVRRFRIEPTDKEWDKFNYEGHRDALVHGGHWPAKTRDRSQFVCRFERSDWTVHDVLLKLYDLPGERIADAAMMGRSFAEWSDHILSVLGNDSTYRVHCLPFLEVLADTDVQEARLLRTYKESLARLILHYKPLITPSTFLLDATGSLAEPDTPENLAEKRCCGLDATRSFVPLSADCRERCPVLVEKYDAFFRQYRDELVAPLLFALKSCHALLVLIDVTMLLAGGVGMYDDNRQMLQDLIEVLDPGKNPWEKLFDPVSRWLLPHTLRPGGIDRIAFVAPKLDLVHPLDRDRMVHLIRRMVQRYVQNYDGLRAEYLNCSAVVSTKVLPDKAGERYLIGVPMRSADGRKIPRGEEQCFAVSELPDDWPIEWSPGTYQFPEVYPRMPVRKDYPPDQINLDRILTFLLG